MMENQFGLLGSTQPEDKLPETNWEEIHSKRLVDSASRHVTEERFEQARLQLEAAQRLFAGTKGIAELLAIAEVCLAAVGRSCPCQSRRHKFPDWYHILKVDEKADISIIKKRYRQLALLLHPDKNTHVKAEGAFKYISQAYDCLSDKTKRVTFNLERAKLFCRRCSLSSEAPDSIPTVSHTASRRSPQYRQEFVSPRDSCSDVCSASELVWESARLQMFRRKARARAEAAGSDLGSRLWKWNKEFEKLNIRRDDTDFERRHIVSRARKHVNEARRGHSWRNKGSRTDWNSHVSMSEFRTCMDDSRQVDMTTITGNGNGPLKKRDQPRVSESLDELLKSLRSTSERAQFSHNKAREQSAYPSFETGYYGSGFRQNLPSTAAIIKYFKDLSASSTQPELADEPKNEKNPSSLKEVYFPSKKGVDSSSVEKTHEQSSSKSQPVVTSKAQRGKVRPERDLSLLDSASLLKNLDAALADISRSAGKSDYSIPLVPPSKKNRLLFETDSPVESSSILSKLSTREKPPRKPLGDERAVKVENNDGFSNSANEKHSYSRRSGEPIHWTSTAECLAENPSMFVTPLRRKQGERSAASEIGSSVLETQSKRSFDSHIADRGSFVPKSHSPVWSSGMASSQAGSFEMSCQTKANQMSGSSDAVNSDEFSSPFRCKFNTPSGLNPLLSPERLGRWMDNLAGSSNVCYRESQEDWTSRSLETSSSGRREFSAAETETKNWWESKEHIPSYLSAKPVGSLLPDYGRIWKQGHDSSDPPKQTPNVTSSTKSDFSCSPAISLASCTRIPSSDFSCTPANSLSYSTKLTGSEDIARLSGLRFLQTGRFERIGNYPATNNLDSTGSEISQRLNLTQISSALNAREDYVRTSIDYAKVSTDFPWLSPRRSQNFHTDLDSCRTERGQHAEKGDDFREGYQMEQNLENHRQRSDELVATLERLREEAKSIAVTLQTYNDSSRISKASTVLQGVYSSSTNGLLPQCQSAPACLTA